RGGRPLRRPGHRLGARHRRHRARHRERHAGHGAPLPRGGAFGCDRDARAPQGGHGMTKSALVDVFATPLRDRLRQLTDRAEPVGRTQTELRAAATAVTGQRERLHTDGVTVAEHWHGTAAQRFGHRNNAATGALTTTVEAIAAADALVTEAT